MRRSLSSLSVVSQICPQDGPHVATGAARHGFLRLDKVKRILVDVAVLVQALLLWRAVHPVILRLLIMYRALILHLADVLALAIPRAQGLV